MSDSEISSFNSRHSCDCYKKLQAYGIPLHISDENELLSEYPTMLMYENAFSLPGVLKINENITEYPVIEDHELSYVFQQMAGVIPNLSDFEENVLSFYILDMIIEGLWTAQNERMSFNNQKVTLLWILYFFNYIQKQNPSRKDLFDHLKVVLFSHEKMKNSNESYGEFDKISKNDESRTPDNSLADQEPKAWDLPLPPDYYENYKLRHSSSLTSESDTSTTTDLSPETTSSSTVFEAKKQISQQTATNTDNMKTILEILYRIFARFWPYLEIQKVFHSMPSVEQVDLPFTLNTPKPLLKTESPTSKGDKTGKKQSLLDKPSEALETLELYKNDFILPLQMAEEAKIYMKQLFASQISQKSILAKNKEERHKK